MFENEEQRKCYKRYHLATLEIKNYNVKIDVKNFFDQPVRHKLIKYDHTQKIVTVQGDDCTTGCLLGYHYFKNYYKMTAIDLSKQQALDTDPKTTHQINFTGNLAKQAIVFFIIEEAKETVLDFSQGTLRVF